MTGTGRTLQRAAGLCVLIVALLSVGASAQEPVGDASGVSLVDALSDRTYTVTTRDGAEVRQFLRFDGAAFIEVQRRDGSVVHDTGTWTVNGETVCRRWQRLRGGRDNCHSMRFADGKVAVLTPGGPRDVALAPGDVFGLVDTATQAAAAARSGKPALIYISAMNCPSCSAWSGTKLPEFRASPEFAQVEFREVRTWYFDNIRDAQAWPDDLKWLRETLRSNGGTPRWFLVDGRRVVAHAFGRSGWDRIIVPSLQRYLARRHGNPTRR